MHGKANAATQDKHGVQGFEQVFDREFEKVCSRRKQGFRRDELCGLALSGGGIRSAVFNLGLMQAFASRGLLDRFDYLSTVSGGGYAGASLSWYLSEQMTTDRGGTPFDLGESFPYGCRDPNLCTPFHDTPALRYLRERGNYLTPGDGIGLMSIIAVALRGMLVSLLVWFTLLSFMFVVLGMFPEFIPRSIGMERTLYPPIFNAGLLILVLYCAAVLAYSFSTWAASVTAGSLKPVLYVSLFAALLLVVLRDTPWLGAALVLAGTMGAVLAFAWKRSWPGAAICLLVLFVVFPFLLGFGVFENSLMLAVAVSTALVMALTILQKSRADPDKRYSYRRMVERVFALGIPLALGLLMVGSIPDVVRILDYRINADAAGPGALLAGAAGALGNFFPKPGSGGPPRLRMLAPVFALLIIYGMLLTSYQVSTVVLAQAGSQHWVLPAFFLATISVFLIAKLVNVNYLSVHRYYRDRLMEAFMPDWSFVAYKWQQARAGGRQAGTSGERYRPPGKLANQGRMAGFRSVAGPLHIVNTNFVLSGSPNAKYNLRGGDNFILTPFHCGGNALGWFDINALAKGQLTLATAMAISGAAANPHTGVGGVGLTRNRWISFLMSLMNVRLGYWLNNPRTGERRVPDFICPGFRELCGLSYSEDYRYIHLSDGGHFENLGIYELVRRRVPVIVAGDGGSDPDFRFGDLQNLIRRVETDFDVRIDFLDDWPIGGIVPKHDFTFPNKHKYADRGHAVARIIYPAAVQGAEPETGILVLLKTTMIPRLSIKTGGYKGENPSFPDQTTADQFFDEQQFEAYRELGFRIADAALEDLLYGGVPGASGPEPEAAPESGVSEERAGVRARLRGIFGVEARVAGPV